MSQEHTRSLRMLNESGDTTISWTPDRDAEVEEIVTRKMAEGCTFFIVEKGSGLRQKLSEASEAMKHRTLAIPDSDWRMFVGDHQGDGTVATLPTPAAPARTVRKAKTPKEVAANDTVGLKPRRGG